jgi:ribosome biogenesis GTPase
VGKSSLLNAVAPGLGLAVGDVSEAVHKGRHTTRVAQLHALPGGGWVADTPGLREIAVWEVDPGELEWAYVEFRPFLNSCRFYDCTHVHEPGCAVRAALERGEISRARYDSYARLLAQEEG